MKKILVFSLIFFAASISTTAFAGKKKDKKQPATETTAQPLKLANASDSTSYAAGMAFTEGLMPYLTGRLNVDTAYLADFIRGYRDAVTKHGDAQFKAYLAGQTIGEQALEQMLPNISKELTGTDDSITAAPFHEGFIAGVLQDTTFFKANAARNLMQERVTAAQEARNRVFKKENEEWLANNKTKPGVITLPSGLQYKVLKEGTGAKPKATDKVNVIYEGKLIDGKVFDATYKHGANNKTDAFRCDQVIKGWTEALTNMPVGSKWEIYIPQNLAYGERQAGEIKPYSTLIFTVELVSIDEPEKKPETTQANAAAKTQAKASAKKNGKKK